MRPAFPASDYYEGSATRPALAEGWPTPLPESRTCFPSSTRLHLHAVLGPACTPGTARCRARHRRMPIKGSTASLPEQGCLCKEETEIPMTPPSPYRERVVHGATLQSAVPFVTITALWLAARGVVGWPPPHCREGFRHDSASGPRACFPSHRPTPGRVPHLEHSTYALLGAPPFAMWPAFPTSDYYEGSATRPALAETGLLRHRRAGRALSGDGAAVGRADPAGLRHPPHRTGRATFTASGSPSGGLDLCGSGTSAFPPSSSGSYIPPPA